MNAVVADTDVLSYMLKGDSRAKLYQPHLFDRLIVISFMTVAELEEWAELKKWGVGKRTKLENLLRDVAIHDTSRSLNRIWAYVRGSVSRAGYAIGVADAWIAATALIVGVPLVTNNPADFRMIPGLTIISEADAR